MAKNIFSFLEKDKKDKSNKIRVDVKGDVSSTVDEQRRIDKVDSTVKNHLKEDHDECRMEIFDSPYKEKGEEWTSNQLNKSKSKGEGDYKSLRVKYVPTKELIECKLLVVCIEITYDIDKIEKLLDSILRAEEEIFIKFVFFSNKLYETDIMFFNKTKKENILEIVKKEKLKSEENDNVILYDALLSTVASEKLLYTKKISVKEDYIIDEIKYMFILSGNEKNSKADEKTVLERFSKLRKQNPNVNLICTNKENLIKVSIIGFRKIVTINL